MTLPLLPHIEDPIKNTEYLQGFVRDSLHVANNNMHNSDDKDIQKGVSFLNATDISCVICAKKLKTEKKNQDLKYHMEKGISNRYSCEYCRISFSAKINLLGHTTNQHKKCDVCQNGDISLPPVTISVPD